MSLMSCDHHCILSKQDEEMPPLAPASVSSSGESYASLTDLPVRAEPLPKVIEAQKRVSFGEVNFRSYPVILGDHPDCIGAPLSFGWDFVREQHYELEKYEAERAPRLNEEELKLSWMRRKSILRQYAGVKEDAIREQTQDCSRIRKQREQTKKRLVFQTNVRHLMAKVSGGLVGERALKRTDRQVHRKRF